MTRVELPEVSSPAELGLAVYERVQELTRGRARKAAKVLTTITCLELNGVAIPAPPWFTLVRCSLDDLATHAPDVKLTIPNWAVHYMSIDRRYGEASADEMTSALMWAGHLWRNVELEISDTSVAKYATVADALNVAAGLAASVNQ